MSPKVVLRAYSKWRKTYSSKSTKSQQRVKVCRFKLQPLVSQFKVTEALL